MSDTLNLTMIDLGDALTLFAVRDASRLVLERLHVDALASTPSSAAEASIVASMEIDFAARLSKLQETEKAAVLSVTLQLVTASGAELDNLGAGLPTPLPRAGSGESDLAYAARIAAANTLDAHPLAAKLKAAATAIMTELGAVGSPILDLITDTTTAITA